MTAGSVGACHQWLLEAWEWGFILFLISFDVLISRQRGGVLSPMTAGSVGIGRGFIYFYQFWCFEWYRVLKKSVWLSGAQEKNPKTKHPNLDLEITLKRKLKLETLYGGSKKWMKIRLKRIKNSSNGVKTCEFGLYLFKKFEFDWKWTKIWRKTSSCHDIWPEIVRNSGSFSKFLTNQVLILSLLWFKM